MSDARDIELLYDVWEKNVQTLRTLHRQSKEKSEIVPKLVAHLRSCAVAIVKRAGTPLSGQSVTLLDLSAPIGRQAACS